MSLAALQRAFQAHILADEGDTAHGIAPQGRRGLPVYRHAYRATLRDALRDTYTRTALWLGDEAFDAAADDYIAATRSQSWTLADYGAGFVDLLATSFADDPEIAELAWLEAALRAAFATAEPAPFAADLSAVDWDQAIVRFAPAVAARTIVTDVPGLWHAMGEERAPDALLLPEPLGLVIWRDDLSPQFRTADAGEAQLIASLRDGQRFAEACALLEDATPDQVGAWLATWLRDGLVADIRTD